LSQVVALLAHKAEANVIAGTELKGTVTANLRRVPLRQAIETVLRMNDLGLIQEEGIYRIVPYTEAVAAKRSNTVLTLKNAKAEDLQKVLQDLIKGTPEQVLTNIAADKDANVLIISGPAGRVGTLVEMAERLDVSQPVLPTVTEAIKLNYADPTQMLANIQKMLSEKIGSASADVRARHIIVTDVPVAVENIRDLVKKLDVPVKQVAIDAMIVDATLEDQADTGVNWLIRSIRSQSKQQAALGTTDGTPNGRALGSLQNLGLSTAALAGNPLAGALNFGVLTKNIDWGGIVQAEVRNNKGRLVSNPVVVAIENQPARIDISQQIPYVEVKQTNAGGSQTNTEFKSIGTVLTVTPRVTHDDNILTDIQAKESGTNGTFNNIPIENKRELQTNLRVPNGRTIFIGGLRKQDQNTTIRKVPVLGDLPVVNILFRNNNRNQKVNELLVFLTCNVLKDEEDLTPYQKSRLADGQSVEVHVDGQGALAHDMVYPAQENDPLWKWRRSH
jgi:type IV pilus secretin PilQ/predicted competence protein